MMKRNAKRALSIILSIILTVTTFFIFDPSVLKIDTQAYVSSSGTILSDEDVFFYVPEIVYLNPVPSNNRYVFQYYVDRAAAANGALTANGTDTTGDVYFKSTSASRVVSITGTISGGVATVGTSSSLENEITTTMSGYSTTYADKIITWTCKYIDKGSGKEMTATAYTRCVAVPCATAGSTVISASSQSGYESTWHDDTKIGVTGWIVGATSVDARKYTISSASAGTEDNSIVGDGRGGYKNNYLESPSTVPTCGRDNISNLYNESYNGGSGYYRSDASSQWPTGGKGTLYIDSSRYTNLGQIPQLYVGIDCNYRYQKSADMILYYDWYSNCNSTYPTTYTAASQSGVSTGSTQRGKKLSSATFPLKTTTTDTLVLHAWSKSYGNSNRTGNATCYLVCRFRDKSILREAYELMIKNSTYLQQAYFTDSAWSTFTTYRSYIYDYLLNPNATATQADLNTYGKNLYNQVSKMVACVKADGGSATAKYITYGTTSTTSVTRSDVLKTGTARVYHRYVTGGSGESITSSAAVCTEETYTYYYGENVTTGFNDFSSSPARGYVKHGFAPGNWSSGSLTLGTGNNTDTFVETSSLEYTYVYLKNSLVNFNANGGSCSTANKTVTYSDIYGDLPTPSRSGYTFNGWFTEKSGGSQVTASTTAWILSDQTLYAQWTPNIYTVNFDPIGGSCSTASKTVTYDSTYGALPTPTRTNYSFSGWFTATIGGSQVTASTVFKNAGNQTLYAQWIANSYTVTFNANGGLCDTATKSVSYDSVYGTLPTPTRTGYTFNGWYTAMSGGKKITESAKVTAESDHTLYAIWTANSYTVTFNANGGSCSTASKSVTFDSPYGTLPAVSRTGYTFNGWFTASSGGTKVEATTTVSTASNHILYAQLSANSYTVTFNANGGSCSATNKSVTFDSAYGALPTASRTGYTFAGWFTAETGGTQVTSSTTVKTATSHTLYAQWSANGYTVTFDPNGGLCGTNNKSVIYDLIYGALPTPTRAGYNFIGWFTASSGGTMIEDTTVVNTASNHTVYAQWSANSYTLSFNANGGSCATSVKSIKYESTYGVLPTASRAGYTFNGWFTEPNGGSQVIETTVVTTTTDQTVYAQWTANSYTVYFDANGGSCNTSNEVVTFDSAYGELPTASRTGYTFTGWYTSEIGGTKCEASTLVKTAKEHILYAHWSANYYTVLFDANGGECSTARKIVVYNSAYGELPTATKSGYTFDGWYTAAIGGTKVEDTSLVATANEHTLYAHWAGDSDSYFKAAGTCVIDGSYIYGLRTRLSASTLKSTYLDYENVDLTIENPAGGRYLGTGSTVTVEYPDGTTEVYTIVIFGDLDGDGNITASDSTILKTYINGTIADDFTAAQKKAANLDGSRRIDSSDFSMLARAVSGLIEIDQAEPAKSK